MQMLALTDHPPGAGAPCARPASSVPATGHVRRSPAPEVPPTPPELRCYFKSRARLRRAVWDSGGMDLQEAVDNFDRAMNHCDNIVLVHRRNRAKEPGRRYQETSLDRGVVVLAVAAWQAAAQDMTTAILDTARPPASQPLDRARFDASVGHARKAIGDFSTPNAANTRRLMVGAGFDPRPYWTWTASGGRGRTRVDWMPEQADTRLDEWLKVRHAIAHGHDLLPVVNALQSVRIGKVTSNPTIRLVDAEQCASFLIRLVRLTANAVASHLGTSVTILR